MAAPTGKGTPTDDHSRRPETLQGRQWKGAPRGRCSRAEAVCELCSSEVLALGVHKLLFHFQVSFACAVGFFRLCVCACEKPCSRLQRRVVGVLGSQGVQLTVVTWSLQEAYMGDGCSRASGVRS